MKSFFATLVLLAAVVSLPAGCSRPDADVAAAQGLAGRIVPGYASKIRFEKLAPAADSADRFELETVGRKLVVRGNNANSMAVGLNHFLKYYARTSVSWFADQPVEVPAEMPVVAEKVAHSALLDDRFFLNYCTFGYTMVWWQWRDWERLIDWMALNGVTLPLAITGQEAVWTRVWQKLGLTDEQVRSYFTGPAHLPWHRMSNLDYWQSPLPQSWLDAQVELQKRIVARERELNMKPVLPAFAGHVPAELGEIYPEAKISRMSKWGGFEDRYRSHFLDPLDPLFARIQKEFLAEQTALFGTDHIYGADPFNEVDPPSWEPEFLARVSRTIYDTMAEADPEAEWLQMTWLFYLDRDKWHDDRIEAFVKAVPQNKMLLLDYYCENTEVWRQTHGYHGQPYFWCYLGNFGGNTMLVGNFDTVSERLDGVLAEGGKNLRGLGSTLEGLDSNPFMYDYVFERAWDFPVDDDRWFDALADRYLGHEDADYRRAWDALRKNVYITSSKYGHCPLLNARPTLEGILTGTTDAEIKYDNDELFDIWAKMIDAGDSGRDTYRFWIVNVGRQALGNLFLPLRDEFTAAYRAKDLARMKELREQMLELAADLETLTAQHGAFSMQKWIDDSRSFGKTPEEQDYYEVNGRTLLTTWGDRAQSINDYANRTWSGLVADYYAVRWRMFLDAAVGAVEAGRTFDEEAIFNAMADFEKEFAGSTKPLTQTPAGDVCEVVRELYLKYKPESAK